MESYISTFSTLFATTFSIRPKAYPEVVQATKLREASENGLIDNEYILSAEYLQEKAYHSSSISHKFAQSLLWCFVAILITPMLVILIQFRSSNYFWAPVTCVIFAIVMLISYFNYDKKEVEETYTTAWEDKTRSVAKIIQDRIYVKDQKTKFRVSHLAQIHRLQSIPENQHPKSISNMRHEMSEKYTAAMKDMTSETRVMLNIYLIVSGVMSTVFLWAAHHYYHRPSSFYEATNYLVLVGKVIVLMIMYMSVLHQTKFWIEELERERMEIMRGWDIVD
ncbi:hypothetical protein OCU04_004970 [Sclerotinia nivalis]|uniref:Uncharacterized protein n=1 Tax=Sclerotinia nivalis TaxID=352851 RepID=A0A9X0DMC2_9HELO|nr:hypothetical protein OCU04_004970 [Sclerotinia nivalis]